MSKKGCTENDAGGPEASPKALNLTAWAAPAEAWRLGEEGWLSQPPGGPGVEPYPWGSRIRARGFEADWVN